MQSYGAGTILPKLLKKMDRPIPPLMKKNKEFTDEEMPGFAVNFFGSAEISLILCRYIRLKDYAYFIQIELI
ncbi:hypothetical protein BK133_25625 [Paenibacillus sp. FSL H8-0548]|uniref:hypothetical protein n=1 Tax=Paenibacillus sp. FSL H8-0548 TaxID=1920422 RepID=UPI00097A10FC|nr:hypothetical protein [Paenibacillus sp. FSL H8-0548]OMF22685.1 hypothetical protein BK133_25625 [Paenibacillus sp. FSL H8-0548]